MFGKDKCRILKDIRRKIADENDIPFVTRECTYQGECTGTCPRCESELRYLEKQLAQRAALGKRITVAALCAGIAVAGTGCSEASTSSPAPDPDYIEDLSGEVPYDYDYGTGDSSETGETECGPGTAKPAQTAEDGSEGADAGGTGATASDPDYMELSGDVPYFYETGDPAEPGGTEGGEDADKTEKTDEGGGIMEIDDTDLMGMVAY